MKLITGVVLGLWVLVLSCVPNDSDFDPTTELRTKMESIKSEFVPDRRLQIFDYEIKPDGTKITGRSSNQEAFNRVRSLKESFPEVNVDSFSYLTPIGNGLINVSVGNIRSNPRHSAELSTQVLMGQQVTIWEKDGYWSYIQTPDDYLGWIDGGALVVPDEAGISDYHNAEKIMYINDFGFCYASPDVDGSIVSDLVAGDILQMTTTQSGFTGVLLPDGRKAYVVTDETQLLESISKKGVPSWTDIKSTAFQFMGRPYLWGGTSGKGVDCSGFTKMVYYLNGLELPRDASQQVRSGVEVSLDNNLSQLQPGDLLFFGYEGENGKKDRVTHVAIHIGDGRIIHSSQRVMVQSLMPDDPDYAPHRRKTLLTAKRMIDNATLAQGVHSIKDDPAYGF